MEQVLRPNRLAFISRVAYLSKADNRLGIIIPKNLRSFIGKDVVFEVIMRPAGSKVG